MGIDSERGHEPSWQTLAGNGVTLGLPAGGTGQLRVVWAAGGGDIAYVVDSHSQGNRNAALIAAAPQLASLVRVIANAGAEAVANGSVTAELEDAILACIVASRRLDTAMARETATDAQPEKCRIGTVAVTSRMWLAW